MTTTTTRPSPALAPAATADLARQALSVLRTCVGAATWIAPARSGRLFGLRAAGASPEGALLGRLFGVRDLALALALRHPSGPVRRLALQAGVVIDGVDVLATAAAVRRGAGRHAAVGVGAGAACFVALGLVALAGSPREGAVG